MTVDVMAQLAIGQQFADAAATGPLMIGILAAAAAGLISFASPCVVPLAPGYMSHLASVVGGEVDCDAWSATQRISAPGGGTGWMTSERVGLSLETESTKAALARPLF